MNKSAIALAIGVVLILAYLVLADLNMRYATTTSSSPVSDQAEVVRAALSRADAAERLADKLSATLQEAARYMRAYEDDAKKADGRFWEAHKAWWQVTLERDAAQTELQCVQSELQRVQTELQRVQAQLKPQPAPDWLDLLLDNLMRKHQAPPRPQVRRGTV